MWSPRARADVDHGARRAFAEPVAAALDAGEPEEVKQRLRAALEEAPHVAALEQNIIQIVGAAPGTRQQAAAGRAAPTDA